MTDPEKPHGLDPRELLAAGRSPDPELEGLFPQLEILELVGEGGMGVVYKARQRELDRLVALKILPATLKRNDPQFEERFRREARALASLAHPNIVAVYDSGESGGLFYFVMEYVDGPNLRDLIRSRVIDPPRALSIVTQICQALEYAHAEGIVHRDIKPENVLINAKGVVKIADFGLAKLIHPAASDPFLTRAGQAMGTPLYMAPEQLERPLEVDHRADLYSLGVVFYELLTGELPLGRFAPPSDKVAVDVRVDEVVLKSLEREPERRYQHAADVRSRVDTISNAPMAARPQDRRPRKKARPSKATPWLVGCLVAALVVPLLLALMGGLWFLSVREEQADEGETTARQAAEAEAAKRAAEHKIARIEVSVDPPESPADYLRTACPSLLAALGEECLNLDIAAEEVRHAYDLYLGLEKSATELEYVRGEGVWSIEYAIVKPIDGLGDLEAELKKRLATTWDEPVIAKADFTELFPYGREELWISIEREESGRIMLRVRKPDDMKNTWFYQEAGPRGWGRWAKTLGIDPE